MYFFNGLLGLRLDAIVGDEPCRVGVVGRDAGGGAGVALFDSGGDGEVQVEKLLEQIFARGETVRLHHGRVECGVGILERVLSGQFERPIDGPQATFDFVHFRKRYAK